VTGDAATEATTAAAGGSDAEPTEPRSVAGSPRLVVTGGGEPDPAQLAALVVALTPLQTPPPEPGPPAWRHAALLEGAGGPAILTPGDLDVASPRGH
jgi:hypothetical protein